MHCAEETLLYMHKAALQMLDPHHRTHTKALLLACSPGPHKGRILLCRPIRAQAEGAGGVQGNHSDLLVQLSHIHSILRGDTTGVKNEDSSQGFVRSTTKYWVSPLST